MIRNLEEKLKRYSEPLSNSEEKVCSTAIRIIKDAIDNSNLKDKDISYIEQGSHANNTNVKNNSDVDIGIVCNSTFFYSLPYGKTKEDYGIINSSYSYERFKMELFDVLCKKFNITEVNYGEKALKISHFKYGDTIINADVVPFFSYKEYGSNGVMRTGVSFLFNGEQVINYPEQNIANSTNKNNRTNYYYKKLVRCFKHIKNDMEDDGFSLGAIKSFVIESILYNLDDDMFMPENAKNTFAGRFFEPYTAVFYNCLQTCKNLLLNCKNNLFEPNGILKIFDNSERNAAAYHSFFCLVEKYCFGE